MNEIEHDRVASELSERLRVPRACPFQIGRFHRHGVNLLGTQRTVREQALAQVREVAVRVPGRGYALVDLNHVHKGPWHFFIGQRPQHRPGGTATAEGHDEAAARGDGLAGLLGRERGAGARDRIGVGQRLDSHGVLTTGFCQPPGGEILESTSLGPQLPGSYS
jgi:hypothetical protein